MPRLRSRTISPKRLTRAVLELEAIDADEASDLEAARPRMRAECVGGLRPCPFVACKHNLYLDINAETGSIKFNYPDLEPGDLAESCSLDVAERGGHTLEVVGSLLCITRERTRQIEVRAMMRLKGAPLSEP